MIAIQELASRFLQYFECDEHGDERCYRLREDSPHELRSMVEQLSGDLVHDEWRYRFIYEALGVIACTECPEENCVESRVADDDLPRWLRSHPSRVRYVNNGVRETSGLPDADQFDIFEVIRVGYYLERNDVYWAVLEHMRWLTGSPS